MSGSPAIAVPFEDPAQQNRGPGKVAQYRALLPLPKIGLDGERVLDSAQCQPGFAGDANLGSHYTAPLEGQKACRFPLTPRGRRLIPGLKLSFDTRAHSRSGRPR